VIASRLGRFIPGDTTPGIHWIGGLVGSRANPEAAAKRKSPSPSRKSDSPSSSSLPLSQHNVTRSFVNKWKNNFVIISHIFMKLGMNIVPLQAIPHLYFKFTNTSGNIDMAVMQISELAENRVVLW
jgi:hypothetical protein